MYGNINCSSITANVYYGDGSQLTGTIGNGLIYVDPMDEIKSYLYDKIELDSGLLKVIDVGSAPNDLLQISLDPDVVVLWDDFSSLTIYAQLKSTQTFTGINTFSKATNFSAVITTTKSVTLDGSYSTVIATNTITITLPTSVGIIGREYYINYRGTSTCTIATTSGQKINDNISQTIYPYESVHLKSDNIGWWVQ